MSSTLIAVVLALVLGHYVTALARLRCFGWFTRWRGWLGRRMGTSFASPFALLAVLVPPLALVAWAQDAAAGHFHGLAGFAFALAMLVYCWGPRDLDLDVEAAEEADDAAARTLALARLSGSDRPAGEDPESLMRAVFRGARRRWFGVLFWFLLLGPFGALLYRLAERTVDHSGEAAPPPAQAAAWRHLLAILDWPVAHLMTLALAVVGHFDAVYGAWRDWHAANEGGGFDFSAGFLDAAARVSVGLALHDAEAERREDDDADDAASADAREHQPPADAPAPTPVLHASMALVWRILVAWLVVLALFVLAGYV